VRTKGEISTLPGSSRNDGRREKCTDQLGQIVVGEMAIIKNEWDGYRDNPEFNPDALEYIPSGAPPTLRYVLHRNQREKLKRLLETAVRRFGHDFYCRRNWPKFDGYVLLINELLPNKAGREEERIDKKRKRTQIILLGSSKETISRAKAAIDFHIDKSNADFYSAERVDTVMNLLKLKEDGDDEESED
jgi:hypothetical protein